jgi:lipid II:glycine glycyltransferase (peptidoglycan interpeptide bridge formation enzyme)
MRIEYLDNTQQKEWNAFVAQQPSFALLQSWEWGEFKEKLGWKAIRIAVLEHGQFIAGAQILIKLLLTKFASIAYIPREPIDRWLDNNVAPQLFSELHRVAYLHRAIYLKIEPPLSYDPVIDHLLQQYHFRSSSYTNQPRATIIVNLNPDLDVILRHMRPTTKQYIKSSSEKGASIHVGNFDDLSSFYNLMKVTSKREHFPERMRIYYEHEWQSFASNNQTVLLMATYQDQLLAVHMAYRFGDHAAYFHGGSIFDTAKLHPNHLLVWEAIKWAKEQDCCTYDLWGVPDEVGQAAYEGLKLPITNRTDNLWGVYLSKSGFSKNVVYYMSAYDYIYNPLIYKLTTNRLLNVDIIDRFSVMMDSIAHS